MRKMMKWCCGPDGKPDFEKVTEFMEDHERTSKFEAIGWALFFIWIGIAWLVDVGMGIGLLGVAAITLGVQALRYVFNVRVEGFWVMVGFGFAIAGFWQWLDIRLPLAPFIFIAVGVALFIGKVWPNLFRKNPE